MNVDYAAIASSVHFFYEHAYGLVIAAQKLLKTCILFS